MDCQHCLTALEHCHEVSLEHADGTTECLDPACTLGHHLHDLVASCATLVPPCPCAVEEQTIPALLAA
jgi:hypothetical protein